MQGSGRMRSYSSVRAHATALQRNKHRAALAETLLTSGECQTACCWLIDLQGGKGWDRASGTSLQEDR